MLILLRKLRHRVLIAGIVCTRAVLSQLAFGVAAIVEDEEGRVLLVRGRYARGWSLPGGGVGAGEPPEAAILRELAEEVGLRENETPELIGLYTRRVLWATNLIALYRVPAARIAFKPNFEIAEIIWADPKDLPKSVQAGAARRLAEHAGQAECAHYW